MLSYCFSPNLSLEEDTNLNANTLTIFVATGTALEILSD